MQPSYRDDLAYIHDAGFGHFAENAARMLIETLRRSGIHGGTVVDLGCGSGILARLLHDAGYQVVGIDLSGPLIEIARNRVPEAVFRIDSFATAEIPPCVAVTAIGEVFNYTFDAANCAALRASVLGRIHAALAPGGWLVFDLAGPARAPVQSPQRNFIEGPDWAVLVEVESGPAHRLLTRRIASFRQVGELYRRDAETHQLQLVDPADTVALLQETGFRVDILAGYGPFTLPQGLAGFLAQKPE